MRRVALFAAAAAATFPLAPVAHSASTVKNPMAEPSPWVTAVEGRAGALGVEPIAANTARVSGGNRYETAVELSKVAWTPENTLVAFIATGENYPDALAMGASAGGAGPILLTPRDSLPAVVAEELARLQPCIGIGIGGAGAVSDQVLAQADTYTAGLESPGCQTMSQP